MTSPVGPEIMFGGYTLFAERGVIIGGASRDILVWTGGVSQERTSKRRRWVLH